MAFEWTDKDGDRCRLNDDGEAEVFVWVISEQIERWRPIAPQMALREAARQVEIYRKALKPFATIYAKQRREGREFLAFDLGMEAGSPQAQALAEACHLMGVLPAEHDDR